MPTFELEEDKPEVGLIQGQMPDSDNEWFVSLALDEQIKKGAIAAYMYQYAINGGRTVRGGVIIDFLVFAPFARAVFVGAGGYYHGKQRQVADELAHALCAQMFGETNVIDLLEEETSSEELAKRAVKEKLT
jgi:hypothetical protein